jgi:16S rRNA (uracil1498-N3)-methyltransferase
MMPRFFVAPEQVKAGKVTITGTDVIHIAKVLRLRVGDLITVLDGRGKVYEAVLEEVSRDEVTCAVIEEKTVVDEPGLKLTLVQGLPKGDKMDFIIQKATELGVSRIIPLACERAVVKLTGDKQQRRLDRWQRIALEAAKQCRRPDIPEVAALATWEDVLAGMSKSATALLPWEMENTTSLKKALIDCENLDSVIDLYVFIGPEGGFTAAEVSLACSHGVRPVTLGPRILRTETAALAVLTMILYQFGELGGQMDG